MHAPEWEDLNVFMQDFATDVTVYNPDGADIILKGIYNDAVFLHDIGEADMDISMPRLTMTERDAEHLKVKSLIHVHDTDFYVYQMKPDGTGMVNVILSEDVT